jgi:nucleoside-diphosphate-sugar epimerase
VYVDDVIEGFLRAALIKASPCNTVDLGSGILTSTREVVERIVGLMGIDIKPAFGAIADRPSEVCRPARIDETEALIGWRPTISLDEGLRRTIAFFANDTRRCAC